MADGPPPLATIGYEKATLADVIDRLKAARVEVVIDVRAVAASRRAGFSKTLLSGSLDAEGIGYRHLRALGTPKAGRQAARAGHTAEMHAIFDEQLATPEAQLQLAEAVEIASVKRAALLCFEAEAKDCHRRIVAQHIKARNGAEVVDL